MLTKHVPGELLDRHLDTLGAKVTAGRAETAPEISSVVVLVRPLEWTEELVGFRERAHEFPETKTQIKIT